MEVAYVLWVLYLVETVAWVRPTQVVFEGRSAGSFRCRLGPLIAGASGSGLFFSALVAPPAISFRSGAQRGTPAADASAAWAAFTRSTRPLELMCPMAFVYALVLVPIAIWSRGLASIWPLLVIGWIGLVSAIAVSFARAARSLEYEDIVADMVAVVLSPPATIRARDTLARRALARLDPISLAYVLCPAPRFASIARAVYFGDADPERRLAVEELVARTGTTESVFGAPARESPQHASYCPACHAQFLKRAGECADCRVLLAVFD